MNSELLKHPLFFELNSVILNSTFFPCERDIFIHTDIINTVLHLSKCNTDLTIRFQ